MPAAEPTTGGHALGRLLPQTALKRPVASLTLFSAVLLVGIISWRLIPVQMMPVGYDFPYLWIWAGYPNATPREVEEQIVRPVEEYFGTLSNLRHMNSRSSSNSAFFELEFEEGTDMAEAYNQALDRIERSYAELPDDLEQFYIYRYDPSDEPVIWAGISVPEGVDDPAHVLETRVQKVLERVSGVGNVDLWGADRRNIYVDFHQDAVDAMGVNLYRVVPALMADNFTMPGGKLREPGRVVYLRSLARYQSIDDLRHWPVRTGLELSEVADVVHAAPAATYLNRINGDQGVSMGIYKESTANTLEVAEEVKRLFEEVLVEDPELEGFKFYILFSQGEMIQESINNLQRAALIGGSLAIVVLIIFLRRLRMTLVVAGAIPVCILLTVTVLYFQGQTINLLSMMGLMLAVGMVVDNSIVVLENIYRHRQEGVPPLKAALMGSTEVSLAVTMATLTTVVVFLPIMFLTGGGMFSFFISRVGLPVCYALVASLFVALIFIPLATTRLSSGKPVPTGRILAWTRRKYGRILNWVLGHRIDATAIALAFMATICVAKNQVPTTDRAEGNSNDFIARIQFSDNMSFEDKEKILVDLDEQFLAKFDEWNIDAVRTQYRNSRSRGDVRVFLNPRERGDVGREQIVEEAEKMLPELPGIESWLGWHQEEGGGDSNQAGLEIYGEETEVLAEIGTEIKRRLNDVEGVVSVEWEVEEDASDELQVLVNREAATRYGVDPNSLARTLTFAMRGAQLPDFRDGEKEIDVIAQYRLEDRRDLDDLRNFRIYAATGESIPLAAVAELKPTRGFGDIHRRDRRTHLTITANLEGDDMETTYARIDEALAGLNMPRGYEWDRGSRFMEMMEDQKQQTFAFLLAIMLVFLLMGMLFESVSLPLSVIVAVPFAMFGAYWMLFLTGTTFDLMAGIGIVIMVGIVVNNAIVLVDLVQLIRKQETARRGYGDKDDIPPEIFREIRLHALLTAGRQRFRPILMTAATTIVGLIPMAVGDAGMAGIPYKALGRVVIGGLITSSVMTLLWVPLLYTFVDDLREWSTRIKVYAFGRKEASS